MGEDRKPDLMNACKSALLTTAGLAIVNLWDENAAATATNANDVKFLEGMFRGFPSQIAPFYEFLLTKNFSPQPFTMGGVNFYMPYGGSDGLPLDRMLSDRIRSMRRLPLLGRDGTTLSDYAWPVPDIAFPDHAKSIQLSFRYSGDESPTAGTFVKASTAGDVTATIEISTGFVRRVLEGCIYASPVIRSSRTLLWQTLNLVAGPSDAIYVKSDESRWSISLLPLLCVTDPMVYAFNDDSKAVRATVDGFYRVYDAFDALNKGRTVPSTLDEQTLRADITSLNALSQLFFLTVMFIVSHETAHAAFLHQASNDAATSSEHERVADEVATIHLFFIALTNTLNASRTWAPNWRFSQLGTDGLEDKLIWFERLFGFGIANNIALRVLGDEDDPYHPSRDARWARNVRVWNNCVLACSRTERAST